MNSANKSTRYSSGPQSGMKADQGHSASKQRASDQGGLQSAQKKSGAPISNRDINDQRSPSGRIITPINDSLGITPEERVLYDQFFKNKNQSHSKHRDDHSAHSSGGKGSHTPGSAKPHTPVHEQKEFSFHDSYIKSGHSVSTNRVGGSVSKLPMHTIEKERPYSRQSPASRKDSDGKASTQSENLHMGKGSKGKDIPKILISEAKEIPQTQEFLDQLLERGDIDVNIQITARDEVDERRNIAEYDIERVGQEPIEEEKGDGDANGMIPERKEYTFYEDWKILQAIQQSKNSALGKPIGFFSVAFWGKINDPEDSKKKLLEGARTADSLRDHYKRTLSNLTVDDIEKIKKFSEDHPNEEEQKQYFCQFKKDGAIKKLTDISNKVSFATSNLKRKTPYNQATNKPSGNAGSKKKASKEKGKIEVTFEQESDDDGDHHHEVQDDISNFTASQLNRTSHHHVASGDDDNSRKLSSSAMMKGFMSQYQHKSAITIPHLAKHEQSATARALQGKVNSKKKVEETVVTRDVAEIKRLKTSDHYQVRSLLVSDSFKLKKKDPERWEYDESLTIYVDPRRKVRFGVFEQPQVDLDKERELKKLLQLAKEYNIDFETLMVLLKKVSLDSEDLENYLKSGNEVLLWEEDQDEDLLSGNKTGLRYLKQIKGEERVQKRRAYLFEQFNQE